MRAEKKPPNPPKKKKKKKDLDVVVLEGDTALGKGIEVRGDDAAGPVHEVELVVAEVVCVCFAGWRGCQYS